ncbi:MAG: GNAT family N-acetyltransferase [Pseudomonadota bacterium]
MKFEIPSTPNADTDAYIVSKTREYNEQFVADDYAPLSVYCRDASDAIIGGLTGKTYWNYLDIEFLWVAESHRGQGLAAQIIQRAEAEATARGCQYAMLDTYEFQALGFYQKQGYETFGQLQDYCGRYARYYLRKQL